MAGNDKNAPAKAGEAKLSLVQDESSEIDDAEAEVLARIEEAEADEDSDDSNVVVPIGAAWRKRLLKSGKSGPSKKILANALIALRHCPDWKGVLRYNGFSHQVEVHRKTPWTASAQSRPSGQEHRAWTDYDDMMLTEWLQKNGIEVPTRLAGDAAYTVARESEYHPVRDYLEKLKWDGVKRIDRWLFKYLGADDTDYHSGIGRRWLISGIARILNPGPDCKADCVLILEGEQGLQKSTALRLLSTPWFLDDLRQFGSKDAAMKIAGRWIVEIAELTAMNETTAEACKSFFGQTMDCFRPPYGKRVIDAPRQCIFAASTNKNVFLKDETGDRRYWPVACTMINIKALAQDRDQLWAEAQVAYRGGAVWWVDNPELRLLAEDEQHMRFEADPWEHEVQRFLRGQEDTTPEDVLTGCFDMEIEDINKGVRNRVSGILRHLRWKRIRSKKAENRDEYVWVRGEKTRP